MSPKTTARLNSDPGREPADSEYSSAPPTPSGATGARRKGTDTRGSGHDPATAPPEVAAAGPGVVADPDIEWQRAFFSEHRLEGARIPRRFWNKTLENFKMSDRARRELVNNARTYISGFNFKVEFPKGLLMQGGVGCGKSHLAVAILRGVVQKGYTGLYYNSPDLLRDIRATFDDTSEISEDDLLERVTETDLLVLDDLGAEKVTEFVLDRFYLIVNKRYEGCKPMIVTTNLDNETLRGRIGDRVVSRLMEMCQTFGPFPREDWRVKDVQKGLA